MVLAYIITIRIKKSPNSIKNPGQIKLALVLPVAFSLRMYYLL